MSDQRSPDIDLGAAHLRPGQRHEPRPEAERREMSAERIPWEGSREGGSANAFVATLWRFVSAPAAAAFPRLSVLQIDAHADTRESYGGSTHSHACVMARVREVCPVVQVGNGSGD